MSCSSTANSPCTCGCCAGTSTQTPRIVANPPGQPAIAYRTGTWATFRESMLARLSSADYPALAPLKTRDPDDFSIALLDASSVVLDILTFYQERLANESYLRTATQLDSLTWIGRLVGYQPSPGVAASTFLAFTLRAATGTPTSLLTPAITIPAGTQAQSVPAQNQSPQTFETSADILAKPDWNALPVRTGSPWIPATGQLSVLLTGTATQLQPGDAILLVGDERLASPASQSWDLRILTSVQPNNVASRTRITWSEPLGHNHAPAQLNPRLYALRQRASLFGFNALNPLMLHADTQTALATLKRITSDHTEWIFDHDTANATTFSAESLLDLDAVYPKLTPGGWLALIVPDGHTDRSPAGRIALYRQLSVTSTTRSDFSVSARITRIATDTADSLDVYANATRTTSVLAQSELLDVPGQPLDNPLYGAAIDLDDLRPDLANIQAVALYGKSQKIAIASTALTFLPDDGSDPVALQPGDTLTLLQPPNLFAPDGSLPAWSTSSTPLTLAVADTNGRSGTLLAPASSLTLAPSLPTDPVTQEFALVLGLAVIADPTPHTRILLQSPLQFCYDRASTTVNANVGPATAGRSVTEILGSGSASTPNQTFTLKQSHLTFTQSPTPTGALSSLRVRANGVAWTEVPTLFEQPPNAQVFTTRNLPGGVTLLQAGDNLEGATLPTGLNNLHATYRVGLGAAGNVDTATITTLVDRPLGVSAVTNPLPATGGQDPQSLAAIRANAPSSVLTLGRAVSLADYQNFAASFSGIAKASALWIPSGPLFGVFLTVASADGSALPPGDPTLTNLLAALQTYGRPNVPILLRSFLETLFHLSAALRVDPAYDAPTVKAQALALLRSTYSFAARTFGQGVSKDEIAALLQSVPGVLAVNVTQLSLVATSTGGDLATSGYSVSAYNRWLAGKVTLPRPASPDRICPYVPIASPTTTPFPAEILVLDPDPKTVLLGDLA